jgi:hypothetical protein
MSARGDRRHHGVVVDDEPLIGRLDDGDRAACGLLVKPPPHGKSIENRSPDIQTKRVNVHRVSKQSGKGKAFLMQGLIIRAARGLQPHRDDERASSRSAHAGVSGPQACLTDEGKTSECPRPIERGVGRSSISNSHRFRSILDRFGIARWLPSKTKDKLGSMCRLYDRNNIQKKRKKAHTQRRGANRFPISRHV